MVLTANNERRTMNMPKSLLMQFLWGEAPVASQSRECPHWSADRAQPLETSGGGLDNALSGERSPGGEPGGTRPRERRTPSTAGRALFEVYGFTMIELALVTVVLAILAVVTIPQFQATAQRLRAEQAACDVAQLLRYAHARAVSEGVEVMADWEERNKRFQLYDVSTTTNGFAPPQPVQTRFGNSRPLPDGVELTFEHTEGELNTVRFFPDGTSETTTVLVHHDKTNYTITVDAPTSRILLSSGTPSR